MGSVFKKKKAPSLDMSKMDFRQAVQDRVKPAREAQLGLLADLERQTGGQGPSLANAEMRAASNKNLAQLLAASAASKGVVGHTAMLNQGAANARDLATAAGKARSQEIQGLQGLRGATAVGQQGQDLQQIMQPGRLLAGAELQRYNADVARQQNVINAQRQMLAGVLSAGGQALSGSLGSKSPGPQTFTSTNPESVGMSYGAGDSNLMMAACGGVVPGYAEGGDNPSNDTVPALLSPGEIVLPRSVTTHENAPTKAKTFVEALLESHSTNKKAPADIRSVLMKRSK